jgi:hypothetical protein
MTLRFASIEMVLYYAVITGMWYSTKRMEEYFVSTFILFFNCIKLKDDKNI